MTDFIPHNEYFCMHCNTILKYTKLDDTLEVESCSIHPGGSVFQLLIQNEELSNHYKELKNAIQ